MEDNNYNAEFRTFIDSIVIVLVLYKSDLYKTAAFMSLNDSIRTVASDINLGYYVFDNSPEPSYNDGKRMSSEGIKYKHDLSNPGLSQPSNEGAQMAIDSGRKWILFTNPDTCYPLDYFQKLYEAVVQNSTCQLFAPILISNKDIVSPSRYNFFIGSSPDAVIPGINDLKKKLILYSGMFVSTVAFSESKGFNDKIKLDFMDCYFTENFKRVYSSFYLLNVECQHDLSSYEKNVEKVLNRFKYYCEGAKYFASSMVDSILLFMICFARGVKLSFKFKNVGFPIIVFKVFSAR